MTGDDKATNLKTPWTVHDLRRTCATGMADLGVLPHVIEAVLNHVSGHKSGVAGVYIAQPMLPRKGRPSIRGQITLPLPSRRLMGPT